MQRRRAALRLAVAGTLAPIFEPSPLVARSLPGSDAVDPVLPPLQRVTDHVYASIGSVDEAGAGNHGVVGNIGVIVGSSGSIVINTGSSFRHGEQLIDAAEQVGGKPVVLAIITQPIQEFVMGAAAFEQRGIPVLAHSETQRLIRRRCETCLRNLERLLGNDVMQGTRVVAPTQTISASKRVVAGGRPLRLMHFGWGQTPGDLVVFDPASGVLFSGALVCRERVPDLHDADVNGLKRALDHLRRVPTRALVPGYGPVGTPADIQPMIGYVTAVDDAVAGAVRRGIGLSQALRDIQLPHYAGWPLYDGVHARNVQRLYLAREAEEFGRR